MSKVNRSFSLYDRLAIKSRDVVLNDAQKTELCCTLSQLSRSHSNMVYALIHHHALVNNHRMSRAIPYKGKTVTKNSGVIIKISNMPPELVSIIHEYVEEGSVL